MDELITVLLSKADHKNWLVLWLAFEIWKNWKREQRYEANVKLFVEVARNSTAVMAAFMEMMKSRKERAWGEEFDEDFHAAQERAARRLSERPADRG